MASYTTEKQDNLNVIQCPAKIGADSIEEFKNLSKNWALEPVSVHIFNFEKTREISPNAFQPFVLFKNTLKKDNKYMFSVKLKPSILEEVVSRGLEHIFSPVKSIKEASKISGQRSSEKINVKFINPFLIATKNTLSIHADTEAQPLRPFIREWPMEQQVSIVGVINFTGDQFSGSITLCFPQKTIQALCKKMSHKNGFERAESAEGVLKLIMEKICTNAESELYNDKKNQLKTIVSEVLTTEKIETVKGSLGPTFVLPFNCPEGEFHIEIETSKNR